MPFEPEDLVPIAQHVGGCRIDFFFSRCDKTPDVGLPSDRTSHHGGDGVAAEA